MAQRPLVGGAVAVGIVAAALRMSLPGPSSEPQPSLQAHAFAIHGKHAVTPELSQFDQKLWFDEMKNHPENLGRLSGQKQLDEVIGDFSSDKHTSLTSADGNSASAPVRIQVMIAIEPDPAHTHLALRFDRDLDALQDALQDSGWRYQSNWLPWSPISSPSIADHFVDREQERLFLEGREQFPGVLLFRPAPDCSEHRVDSALACQPLAVFIVGNSPIAGIDRSQFKEALLRLRTLSPDQAELRIVGPSFTGSCQSLNDLLKSDEIRIPGLRQITIASGSVSANPCVTIPTVDYRSFGVDRDFRTQQTFDFLSLHGHFKSEEIAELNEDESSYGSYSEAGEKSSGLLQLYFPRNISHLRSAYQKSNIFGFGSSTQGAANTSLNLNFDESKDDDDAIPSFAVQQTPVSQDGIMRQISDTLEQRKIKVVILTATDVLDEIFVAEILARQAPNTLVVINQADDLFLRSNSAGNFENMYFISPWPLITDSRFRGRPIGNEVSSSIHTFPSDLAEGLYTAVRYLVTPRCPPALNCPVNANLPKNPANRPPLWVTVIGHGDYWPVALLDEQNAQDEVQNFQKSKLPNTPQDGQPGGIAGVEPIPISQLLLLLLLTLFSLYHSAKCLQISGLAPLSFRYAINDPDARTPKLFLQLTMTFLLLLSLQLCISPLLFEYVMHGADSVRTILSLLPIGAGALCIALAYLIYSIALVHFDKLGSLKPEAILLRILILVMFSCIAFYLAITSWHLAWNKLSGSSDFPLFFSYRAAYPLRGVSPVFPLFVAVAAFFFLCYNHLDRISFTRNLTPRLPGEVRGLLNCPTDAQLEPVTSLLVWRPNLKTLTQKTMWLAMIFTFVSILLKPIHLRPRMFEGVALQKSLGAAMFLLVAAILWELFMAATLWHRLKSHCLDKLESSSLRRGFSSISGLTWKTFWIIGENHLARYRAVTRLLEQALRHVLDAETLAPLDNLTFTQAYQNLSAELKAQPYDPRKAVLAFGLLQERIAYVAQRLLVKLQTAWLNEKTRITAPDARETEEQPAASPREIPIEPLQELQEEWVALVYVHYIRMVLLQMRSRLLTAVMLYLFLVWTCTSYPYLNRHSLLIALSVLLGVLAFTVISIYASVNRDAILSRSTNHAPGHLDLDFYFKVASFVGIPLVAFVASQFPEVSSFLFSWIEPGMAVAK